MSDKHTPGQWFINRESYDCLVGKLSIEVDGDYFIAQVDEGLCQESNALLIAAAPDLLEALSNFVAFTEQHGEVVFSGGGMSAIDAMNACTTNARAAIAKAKGEKP